MSILKVGPADFEPGVVIFDKDGTLIEFNWMWAGWMVELASRLDAASGMSTSEALYTAFGFDAARNHVLPHGLLAATPMTVLYGLTERVLQDCGLSVDQAKAAVARAWYNPDPVTLAKPVGELTHLFTALKNNGIKIAVATTDDREPTLATLGNFNLWSMVDTSICADDGIPVKPAPDMIQIICKRLNVPVASAVMVGDSIADLQMGKAAGAGLVVGVLSGVSPAEALTPDADVIIENVMGLII
jgi:phosphoglycolate phosphatase